ncbi:MAG: DNA-formamidopyrimidine glycosylase family protein [Verrucomicrobiota bacterium]
MPELAEVEFYRKRWNTGIKHPIQKIYTKSTSRVLAQEATQTLRSNSINNSIIESSASGKQMLFRFEKSLWLGVHLGMTGKLISDTPAYQPGKHDHLILFTENHSLIYQDPRAFGKLKVDKSSNPPHWWQNRAPDILTSDFSLAYLKSKTNNRTGKVKALLLDQSLFPGIGNWMADEICWRCDIHPETRFNQLSNDQLHGLWKETRQLCRQALRVIGRNWSTPPNDWLFNHRWKPGGICPKCNKPLDRSTVNGRTTCFCNLCQK